MNLGDLGVVSLLKNRTGPYIAQSSESNKKPIYVLTQNDIGTLIAYGSEKGWRVNTFALIDNHISSSIINLFILTDLPSNASLLILRYFEETIIPITRVMD